MSTGKPPCVAAGSAMAAWSAKALLITAGVFLVGRAIWYARSATVPLIVAALISTQLLPLIDLATRRGMSRGLAVAASVLGVIVIGVGLAWRFSDALFGNLGGVGEDISDGADKVVAWLGDNNDWVMQHEDAIHNFLKEHPARRPRTPPAASLKVRSACCSVHRELVSLALGWSSSSTCLQAATPSGAGSGTASARTAAIAWLVWATPPGTPRAATSAASV